jgi:hypothetical protein
MGLTVFFALCILGLDFMIYVLFKLTYGEKRSVIARRVAEQRKAAQLESSGLFLVPARKNVPAQQEPNLPSSLTTEPPKLFARHSHTKRIA